MSYISIAKANVKFFIDKENGYLRSIMYKEHCVELHKSLWEIRLSDGIYKIDDATSFDYLEKEKSIELFWESELFFVKVTAICDSENVKWKIALKIKKEHTYIYDVVFPIIGNIKSLKSNTGDDYLLLPWQNGWIIKNPINTLLDYNDEISFCIGRGNKKYENEYPAQFSFQFAAYYEEKSFGYYFSTQDSDVYIKTMGFYKGEKDNDFYFALKNYPENMGKTKYYSMPYSFVLDFFEGDWQIAANKYREFAMKQKWCKNKLHEKHIPANILNTDLWLINHTNYKYGTKTEEYFKTVIELKKILNRNIALHWYGWNKGKHDVNYPDYISNELKDKGYEGELVNWNRKFKENNIVKIPYVNARLWDLNTSSYKKENAQVAALKNESNELYIEPWNGNNLKPMCPATLLWKEKIVDFCSKYINEYDFDGIYIDQVGSFNATLCFDELHPHPVGGGMWWNKSYHDSINMLRELVGEDKILTTESCCETYIDIFDLFLILDTNLLNWGFSNIVGIDNCKPIALFGMIYGDRALSYGSICNFSDSIYLFKIKLVRNLFYGILPTIEAATYEAITAKSSNEHIRVLKEVLDFYTDNRELFIYGRLKEVKECDCGKVLVEINDNGMVRLIEFASALEVIWEDKNGNEIELRYSIIDRDGGFGIRER